MRRHSVARAALACLVVVAAACSGGQASSNDEEPSPPTTSAPDTSFCLELQDVRDAFGLEGLEGPTGFSDIRCGYRVDSDRHEATASWWKPTTDKAAADKKWLQAQKYDDCVPKCSSDSGGTNLVHEFRTINGVVVVTTLQDFGDERVVHVNTYLRTPKAYCALEVNPEGGSDPNPYEDQAAKLIKQHCPA